VKGMLLYAAKVVDHTGLLGIEETGQERSCVCFLHMINKSVSSVIAHEAIYQQPYRSGT
jgi:hypothetical protein